MPRMYRSMKSQNNLVRPVVGDTCTKLGVRTPTDLASHNGNASPGEGGMSVVSSIAGFRFRVAKKKCNPEMLPRRLHENGKIPGADNSLHVFRIGEGPFRAGLAQSASRLEPDGDEHGTLQPAWVMPYTEYRQAIVATHEQWTTGEEDE